MYENNVTRIEELTKQQNAWRINTLNLIASENVLSLRARGIMGSDFAHRYAEGHPGERYYQGTDIIDEIETRLKKHLKSLFHCRQVDVRPISGTMSNDAVFSLYIKPGDVVMVNSTPGGGHISHHKAGSVGKYTANIINFPLTADGYHTDVAHTIDYAKALNPKVMIMGKSLFLFPEPVKELADFCKEHGIVLIYDAAHVLGLIAGRQFQDPIKEGAFIMTGSTHKTFFGSQRGLILSNVGEKDWRAIDKGAFPGSSSNHHLDTLVALTIATYEMMEFGQEYARQIIANAKTLGQKLYDLGFNVQAPDFGFTESHQIALDVTQYGGGDEVARHLKDNHIILNMNLLPFEPLVNVTNPAGIRIGVQEMTRFGMKETEMETIAFLFKKCLVDGKHVGDEVKEFRQQYQKIQYSFDDVERSESKYQDPVPILTADMLVDV
ncbi:serine hydroxymethyltransferase [Candidatus Vecturithrix granuli]|uniref:Serine hydroxymethyltransferase n=1 Tax=Vecturithrix granuli TaxID=1499967 RepID=A0A081BXJ2_VECG1|nr:serine hydroxymethyltransferase [Candidatus Vecturithrix granuli]